MLECCAASVVKGGVGQDASGTCHSSCSVVIMSDRSLNGGKVCVHGKHTAPDEGRCTGRVERERVM